MREQRGIFSVHVIGMQKSQKADQFRLVNARSACEIEDPPHLHDLRGLFVRVFVIGLLRSLQDDLGAA